MKSTIQAQPFREQTNAERTFESLIAGTITGKRFRVVMVIMLFYTALTVLVAFA